MSIDIDGTPYNRISYQSMIPMTHTDDKRFYSVTT